jgi:ubiquinone/menaquinone biosynthesis C-methylase UbiE
MGSALCCIAKATPGESVTVLSPAEAYELWADQYDEQPNPVAALSCRAAKEIVRRFAPKTVIDVGCGTGRIWWNDHGLPPNKIIGLDIAPRMLAVASRYCNGGTELVQADASHLPVGRSVADLVLCCLTLGYCQRPESLFTEFARVAKAGAQVATIDLHPEALAAGWTRSFTLRSRKFLISNYSHSLEFFSETGRHAGLTLQEEAELSFGVSELEQFQLAGKADRFEALTKIPALYCQIWQKQC